MAYNAQQKSVGNWFMPYVPFDQRTPRQTLQEMKNNLPTPTKTEDRKQDVPTGTQPPTTTSAPQPSYNPYAEYMAYLEKQRAEQQAARDRAAETARKNQQGIFDTNANKLNQQANSAQQQAYINYMLSKRDLPQQLSAQGLSGGAAESTYANLYNSYGNSRNTTEQNRLNNLADLQQTLQNNLAQIEQQRLSGDQADIQNYYANLSNLAAQNIQSTASLRQGSGGSGGGTNYAKNLSNNYYSQYLDARGKGYNDTEASALAKEGIGQYVFSLLSSGLIDQAQADAMMKGFGF